MRVGFLGVQCGNPNLGVAALGYSVLRIMHQLLPDAAEFVLFSPDTQSALDRVGRTLSLDGKRLVAATIRHRHIWKLHKAMRSCDLIIDLTGGDSFSDIYGLRRLMVNLADKEMVLLSGTPLVIAPQTIGPFRSRLTRPVVRHVLNNSALVFARDELSRDAAAAVTRREVVVATDVALALPFDRSLYPLPPASTVRVGVNVSGLLWNGGYTKNNQFGLLTDYRKYCSLLVDRLHADGLEVHLIPHVIGRGGSLDEDDVTACEQILANQPGCTLAPRFRDPVEAKSYIASLDVMVGARMHATIAAFTAGLATIPLAYSRKFAGYYSNLGYADLVDLTELDTASALDRTAELINDRERLQEAARRSHGVADKKLAEFTMRLAEILPAGNANSVK
ncbi:polysaccharide pyruvyl transferase family protein [Microlunatus phosphovorus]|nr:polysaccharide pyruvyl transferase family protein [Microlunatus phosphovorus]